MPITVDYTPAGLAMDLAKKAGRAKGRAAAAQTSADKERLAIAREGQMLQAQTAQKELAAQDRRFEISSALDLMNQKSQHMKRLRDAELASDRIGWDQEKTAMKHLYAQNLLNERGLQRWKELERREGGRDRRHAVTQGAKEEKNIQTQAKDIAGKRWVQQVKSEDLRLENGDITKQFAYIRLQAQISAVSGSYKRVVSLISSLKDDTFTPSAREKLYGVKDKDGKMTGGLVDEAEKKLNEMLGLEETMNDYLANWKAKKPLEEIVSYEQMLADAEDSLRGTANDKTEDTPEATTTADEVNEIHETSPGAPSGAPYMRGYGALTPSDIPRALAAEVGVEELRKVEKQGGFEGLEAKIMHWMRAKGVFVKPHLSFEKENLGRIEELVGAVLLEIQKILDQDAEPVAEGYQHPTGMHSLSRFSEEPVAI